MNNHKKIKTLSRHCPECRIGRLSIVEYMIKKDGVQYFEYYEECDICDYSIKIKEKRKAKNYDDDLGW